MVSESNINFILKAYALIIGVIRTLEITSWCSSDRKYIYLFFFLSYRQSAAKQLLDVLHLAVSTVEVRKYVEQDVIEEVFLHIQNLAEDKGL